MLERPFHIPDKILRRLHPLNTLRLWMVHNQWLEYKNLATFAAEDFDRTRSSGQPSETLEDIAYTDLLFKTMAWTVESAVGIGLIVAAKVSRRRPLKGLALVGGVLSLLLATQDFKDAARALHILTKQQDN